MSLIWDLVEFRHIFTKKGGRLLEVGNLSRMVAEILQNSANVGSLENGGGTAKDKIISKGERVNRRASRTKGDTREVGVE
jgi:hypothetical protein